MESPNGHIVELPSVEIVWNPETEQAQVRWKGFKTLPMVHAVLEMAADEIKYGMNVARAQVMQQKQLEALQEQAMRQKLNL